MAKRRADIPAGHALAIASSAACLLLAGCVEPTPIKGEDYNVFFPTARLTLPLAREGERTLFHGADGTAPATPPSRTSLAIDADYFYARGNSSQRLKGGEFAVLEDTIFPGPAKLTHDYKLHAASVTLRGGGWVENIVGLEAIVGAGGGNMDLRVESENLRERDQDEYIGIVLGAQLSLRPAAWLTAYARATVTTADPELVNFVEPRMAYAELGAEVSPFPGIGIIAGWQTWDYEREGGTKSDIDLEFSGPYAGVHITF